MKNILLLVSLLLNIFLLVSNNSKDEEIERLNFELNWDKKTKDSMIDNRDILIKTYREQYDILKKIIWDDTGEIVKLKNENEELKKKNR